jgi:hypothetical protein
VGVLEDGTQGESLGGVGIHHSRLKGSSSSVYRCLVVPPRLCMGGRARWWCQEAKGSRGACLGEETKGCGGMASSLDSVKDFVVGQLLVSLTALAVEEASLEAVYD